MKSIATHSQLAYTYAQKMNDSASLCVRVGQYDRAISSLTKALRISRANIEMKNDEDYCKCHLCLSDGGISFSESRQVHPVRRNVETESSFAENSNELCFHRRCRKRRRERSGLDYNSNIEEEGTEEDHDDELGEGDSDRVSQNRNAFCGESNRDKYLRLSVTRQDEKSGIDSNELNGPNRNNFVVYRQLIRVPELSMNKGCDAIGYLAISNLSLIIITNLAIVCHLKVIANSTSSTIDKAIQLYQVACNCLKRYKGTWCIETYLQFQMILSNNLSHAHKLRGSDSLQRKYLRELLSTLMAFTDYKSRHTSEETRSQEDNGSFLNMEGFLANASPLVSNTQCADAA
jgi:hypothetical protein